MVIDHYRLMLMRRGALIRSGMYTSSDAAASPDIARQLARPNPIPYKADAVALVQVTQGPDDVSPRLVIVEVLS